MQEIRTRFKAALDADDQAAVETALSMDPKCTAEILKEITALGPWLNIASKRNSVGIIHALLKHGADPNLKHKRSLSNALDVAAGKGRLEVVQALHSAGAIFDVAQPTCNPLFSAIYGGSLAIVEYLLQGGIDATAEYKMAEDVRYDSVCFALERGEREIASRIALYVASGDREAAQIHLDRAWAAVKRANHTAKQENIPPHPILQDV